MRINHNIASLNTYRQLSTNSSNSAKSLEKLSSGLRINRAGDDAAGLAISEKMRGQIRGLDQASRNAQDSISLIQTAEGALNESHSILQRMRELAVQASNDTNTTEDRDQIQKEINSLTSEINRIGNTTEFNQKKLLNGDFDFTEATSGVTAGDVALGSSVVITNTDTNGSVTAGAYGTTGTRAPKASAATATGTVVANTTAIVAATNNELTLKVDGVEKHITFNAAAAGAAALTEINTQLNAIGVSAKFDSGNKLVLSRDALGSSKSLEIVGGGFASSFLYNGAGAETVANIAQVEGKDINDVWVHGNVAAEVTGSINVSNGASGLGGSNITIDAAGAMNELTISVDGTEKTLTLSDAVYDGTAGNAQSDLLADINAQILAEYGSQVATASVDSGNNLVLTSATTTASSSVKVLGGGAADLLFGTVGTRTTQDRQAANNTLDFKVDGSAKSVTIASQTYQDLDEFISVNAAAFTAKGVTASNESGVLKLISNTTGSASSVTEITTGDLAKQIGLVKADGTSLNAGNFIAGANGNTTLELDVDGETVNAVIQEGTYTNKETLAAAVQNAINDASTTAADVKVSVTADGKLSITSGSTGTTSEINIQAHATKDAAGILGLTSNSVTTGTDEANAELTFQIGANKNQSMGLKITDMRAEALGIVGTGGNFTTQAGVTDGTDSKAVEKALDVSTSAKAASAIEIINTAINTVSTERSKLGANQNRLEHTINNLQTSSENLTSAESRIRDVDMAKEMMEFTKNNILSQAAQAMLAQANQQPQGVLQLLR